MSNPKLLITGANGKLGRQVVDHLINTFKVNTGDLVLTTRKIEDLNEYAQQGIEVRQADFDQPETLETAFAGVDRLLLISIDVIGDRERLHTNAIKAAEKADVKHISYTSMPAPEESPLIFAHEHRGSEQAIKNSDIPFYSILRNNWYYENLPEFNAAALATKAWLTLAGSAKTNQLSRNDLALAAAASIYKGEQQQRTRTLNGRDALSVKEMALAIKQITDIEIQVIEMDDEGFTKQLEEVGLPAELIGMLVSLDQHNRAGFSEGDTKDFAELTGQEPQSFEDWLKDNKAQLIALAS